MPPDASGDTQCLPLELSSFLGRRTELRQVRALLRSRRLVTLTGVGGVGKTRLALRVAAELAEKRVGSVWFVELAPITEEQLVVEAVARTLGVREAPGSPLFASVVGHLRPYPALLVLDNCEHLIESAGRLASGLMQACPHLVILATSREPLRCDGEVLLPIPPLSLPPASASVADMHRSEAVQLFVDRAATAAGFILDDASAPDVTAVCQRLDGLPLALELAAGMLRAVSPHQLASRLGQSMQVLRAGSRTGPARHATLEATIDWSYRLLTPAERRVFERLGVFVGGASLEAAEAVCADDHLGGQAVLPTLAALVDKSLVVAESAASGTVRYRQLETLREYARARLVEQEDEASTLIRHGDFFLALARSATPGPHTEFRVSALEQLASEHDNLRAALHYLGGSRDERQLTLATALWFFWFVHGHYREGAAWLQRALEGCAHPSPVARSAALCALVEMIWPSGQVDRVVALSEESLKLARLANDAWHTAMSLQHLSIAAMLRGDPAAAVPLSEDCVAMARTTGDRWLVAVTLHVLGNAIERTGDAQAAEMQFQEVLRLGREANDDWLLAYPLANLTGLLVRRGELKGAHATARESLELAWRMGDRRLCALMLLNLAVLADRMRRSLRAARLLGAGEAQYERLGATPEAPPDGLDDLRAATSHGALALARAKGRALTLPAAVEEALVDGPSHGSGRRGGLTRREMEIAALVSQGLSNLQIAQRLSITEGTTQNHLSHILDRLGLTSRTQVAAWVLALRDQPLEPARVAR